MEDLSKEDFETIQKACDYHARFVAKVKRYPYQHVDPSQFISDAYHIFKKSAKYYNSEKTSMTFEECMIYWIKMGLKEAYIREEHINAKKKTGYKEITIGGYNYNDGNPVETLHNVIDSGKKEPIDILIDNERIEAIRELFKTFSSKLSKKESIVLEGFIDNIGFYRPGALRTGGGTYERITKKTGFTTKEIDNTLIRIKKKAREFAPLFDLKDMIW